MCRKIGLCPDEVYKNRYGVKKCPALQKTKKMSRKLMASIPRDKHQSTGSTSCYRCTMLRRRFRGRFRGRGSVVVSREGLLRVRFFLRHLAGTQCYTELVGQLVNSRCPRGT